METRTDQEPDEQINPLRNIAGIAFDMELQIQDAIGVARTAHDMIGEDEVGDPVGALRLILYRLEQIQEGHALIAKNAPYRSRASAEEGGLS